MKLNKSHPQWLGDYDVFAVDINNKSIWIVECKVIEKVATFYDMYRQQNRFFNEHKEDEKFQRRIDYLRENADQVIQQLGCTDYIGYYSTNKAADELVNPDLVVPDDVTKGEIVQNVSQDADAQYQKNWTEFKAACD